jgi:hypothetical protein
MIHKTQIDIDRSRVQVVLQMQMQMIPAISVRNATVISKLAATQISFRHQNCTRNRVHQLKPQVGSLISIAVAPTTHTMSDLTLSIDTSIQEKVT